MDPGGEALFTLPVALSVLVFFVLCCQCAATVVTLGRETRSLRWALFAFGYMTALAYAASLVTYQVASMIGGMG
jgi:ferrous iron transport protein B